MICQQTWIVPTVSFILGFFGSILCYYVTVVNQHHPMILPLISDTGIKTPERCYFTIFFNMNAFVYAIVVYIRYRQEVSHIIRHNIDEEWKIYFQVTAICGYLTSIGMVLVASFQKEDGVSDMHYLGGVLSFSFFLLWSWLESIVGLLFKPPIHSKTYTIIRWCLAIIQGISYCSTAVCFLLSPFPRDETSVNFIWEPHHPNYYWRVGAAASEWTTGFASQFFILTYAFEFFFIKFHDPHLDHPSLRAISTTKSTTTVRSTTKSIPSGNSTRRSIQTSVNSTTRSIHTSVNNLTKSTPTTASKSTKSKSNISIGPAAPSTRAESSATSAPRSGIVGIITPHGSLDRVTTLSKPSSQKASLEHPNTKSQSRSREVEEGKNDVSTSETVTNR